MIGLNLQGVIDILTLVLSLSLVLCFIRLILGPDIPNRTVAFDAIAVNAVGILVLFAMRADAAALVDVAIVTAVLGFLGTTMLARYLEKTGAETSQPTQRQRHTEAEYE